MWHVGLARERKLDKYRVEGQAVQRTHSHRIASQSLSYVIASAVPWPWGLIINTFDLPYFRGFDSAELIRRTSRRPRRTSGSRTPSFSPSRDCSTFLVYVRPRYIELRERDTSLTKMQALGAVFSKSSKRNPDLSQRHYRSSGSDVRNATEERSEG